MSSAVLYRIARGLWPALALAALGLFLAGVPLEASNLNRGFLGLWWHPAAGGLVIDAVTPGLLADRSGIRPGDVIILVNSQPVNREDQSALQTGAPGSHVNFLVRSPDGRLQQRYVIYDLPGQLAAGLPRAVYIGGLIGLDLLFILIYFGMSALIIWRAPGGWFPILAAYALVLIPVRIPTELVLLGLTPGMEWLTPLNQNVGFLLVPLALTLFPDGRWRPRWIWVYPLTAFLYGLASSLTPLKAWVFQDTRPVLFENLFITIGLIVQAYRYRTSNSPVERRQIRWALFGISAGALGYLILNLAFAYQLPLQMFPGLRSDPVATYAYLLSQQFFYLPLILAPLALAASILRFRLWDVDLIIRRTLIYTLVTTALAGIYFTLVVFLQWLFRLISGEASNLALILSTLAIIALFAPVRSRAQNIIDRRFFRRKYDTARTLEVFAAAARSDVDLDHLSGELLRVVDETLKPAGLSLWLLPQHRRPRKARLASGENGEDAGENDHGPEGADGAKALFKPQPTSEGAKDDADLTGRPHIAYRRK